jgi:hypothetical protein
MIKLNDIFEGRYARDRQIILYANKVFDDLLKYVWPKQLEGLK